MFDDKRRNIEVQSSKLIEILVYHQSFSLFHILCCWWIDEWNLWVEIIDFKKETYNFKESLNECIESRKKDSYSLLEILKLRSIICKIVRPIVIVVVTDPGRKIRTNDYRQIGLSFRDDSIASSIKEEEGMPSVPVRAEIERFIDFFNEFLECFTLLHQPSHLPDLSSHLSSPSPSTRGFDPRTQIPRKGGPLSRNH